MMHLGTWGLCQLNEKNISIDLENISDDKVNCYTTCIKIKREHKNNKLAKRRKGKGKGKEEGLKKKNIEKNDNNDENSNSLCFGSRRTRSAREK